MDTSQIKKYAIQARRDFIAAVTARAKRIGAGPNGIEDYQVRGDFLIIGEQTFPRAYKQAFSQLGQLIAQKGFDQLIDEVAYTWFNRFIALRYMEIQDYLPHGLRVLSSKDSNPSPEIMRNPLQLDFSVGVNKAEIKELFEAGNKEEELYRALLIAQCNELHSIIPFLFERVSDLSELLLPDGLLASDSIIRSLATEIDEAEWQQGVEIIGWIYQFYISEKKDEVIGKVVKSQDIPAATQLFTPNWIVKYLVENSVGSYWLGTYPESPLVSKMEYYIKPAKQEPEVEEELKRITPKEINPESITVIDPACGSGHILVEAYNLLKEIYLERGYRPKDIPKLILEKNLFGLDIDTRAAQLAALALLLRARADDRSIFSSDHPVQLNIREILAPDFKIEEAVQCLTQGKNIAVEQIEMFIANTSKQVELGLRQPETLTPQDVREFFELFVDAKTFGSLIQIPEHLKGKISTIGKQAEKATRSSNLFEQPIGIKALEIVKQAEILGGEYDAVIANPPYMGAKFFTPLLKTFINKTFSSAKSDLFAAFLVRLINLTKLNGYIAPVTLEAWMFLSSYEEFRSELLKKVSFCTFTHMPYQGRSPVPMRINFGTSAYVARTTPQPSYIGRFNCLRYFELDEDGHPLNFPAHNERLKDATCEFFSDIPGSPIAYWISDKMRHVFKDGASLGDSAFVCEGITTSDNACYVRGWSEVSFDNIYLNCSSHEESKKSSRKWYPYNKGGENRRWYGNNEFVVNWQYDGQELLEIRPRSTIRNAERFFCEGVTWTKVSSAYFGARYFPQGYIFDNGGSSAFEKDTKVQVIATLLCSVVATKFLQILNPSLNFKTGDVALLPISNALKTSVTFLADCSCCFQDSIQIARADWDIHEYSWDFQLHPLLNSSNQKETLSESYKVFEDYCLSQINHMRELEEGNNRLYISIYNLETEISPEVPEHKITLYRSDRPEDIKSLLSYSIGCMMGRYSLDTSGLIYANSANIGFDSSKYKKFPADSDGIIPLMDHPWFEDDATTRFISFLKVAWSEETLSENLKFVAESVGNKNGETPEETIQRYLSDNFYKDHLTTYKKRPIYWLFSSGKESAFQALVYLHRYNESTLSKMRTDYVLPLQGKMANEQRRLESQIDSASSPSEKNRCRKELEKLKKKSIELKAFDEKLHHLADQRISLDLDDGVKVNYAKLAPLLACVKDVTGGSDE